MQTEQKGPKYCDQCGYTTHTAEVALAACRRLLTPDDLKWLFFDLQQIWETFREHLPEYALSAGAQEKYNQLDDKPIKPGDWCVDAFLVTAAFLFYVDAVQQIENANRSKPIELPELSKLVTTKLEEALRFKKPRQPQETAKKVTTKAAGTVRKQGKKSG